MSNQEDKKCASLRGRGEEIIHGKTVSEQGVSEDLSPTFDETSELFSIGHAIGFSEPDNITIDDPNIPPLPEDFAQYELDLLPVEEPSEKTEELSTPSDTSKHWEWLEEEYASAPYNQETTEMPTTLHTEEIGSAELLFSSLGVQETEPSDDAPQVVVETKQYTPEVNVQSAPKIAAFEALTETPTDPPPVVRPAVDAASILIGDDTSFEGVVNLSNLDENLEALNRDLTSILDADTSPQSEQATSEIPIKPVIALEEATPPVEMQVSSPIYLRGQVKITAADTIIPLQPETVERIHSEVTSSSMPPQHIPEEITSSIEGDDEEQSGGGAALDLADIINFDDDEEEDIIDSPFDDDERPSAEELFPPSVDADPELLQKFVDDASLQALWDAIENLQAEIAAKSWLTRKQADTYQRELLQASNLLLESRDNYDEARAILYRIRGELIRDERAKNEIEEFAPRLRRLILLWFAVILVLGLLSGVVESVLEDANAHFLAAAYVPVLFGIAGGLFLAYTTLNRHTAVLRNFDRAHLGWYRFAPIIGALMGFLVYTLWIATIVTSTSQNVTDLEDLQYPAIVWILAFLGGLQQNWVINRLRNLRDGRTSKQ